ncbi:OLC1v1013823C1 [Oldenlandia corymbosa var. corymbosa]|uniref:N-alpha-acetyltransferase 40 n=1 Tax=Oldenlandia corymbosa var. corymbosa TaxID=529605 RepID=A0AAV1DZC3_OLDCO|nr:OLC1v1013823C1 [Oldenlandia corymbosa var. corymbosa]
MEAEEVDNGSIHPRKKMRRKELLAKKKAVEEIIKAASSEKDPLSSVHPHAHYHTKGLSVYMESGRGNKLTSHLKQYIQKLLKVNMEVPFGSQWPVEEKVKRKDMVSPEARYIFVYEDRYSDGKAELPISLTEKGESSSSNGGIVGFVHYRFVVEEEVPVLYVYELQLEAVVQGKGLGKFLMQLIEDIACKNRMGAVVLTVQKTNASAMKFYMNKLGYIISATSPSKFSYRTGLETNYEILCKAFNDEAKSVFEDKS